MANSPHTLPVTATNRRVVLKEYVEGYPTSLTGDELAVSVLVRNLYLSCDPLRESYTAAFVPGSVITGYGVARVLDSSDPRKKESPICSTSCSMQCLSDEQRKEVNKKRRETYQNNQSSESEQRGPC
ncbi:hypothetical protein HU200_009723 [Digitaria exilis]|uniref:Uncharacterized protein n=1 Tax=Digitaria exilis TaxID=1010633 RepID=A0A835KP69_9POAL|nr:hypothetical protein HU200_009723 [Digitaria exilis]